jgi:glycosyltransferase involved in cell wall biosynthesis
LAGRIADGFVVLNFSKPGVKRMGDQITVVFVMTSLAGGGAEKILIHILDQMDRDKFRIKLFVRVKEGIFMKEIPSDVSVKYGIHLPKFLNNSKLPFLVKLLRLPIKKALFNVQNWLMWYEFKPFARDSDVIVGFLEQESTYLSAKAGKKLSKKCIGWIHIDLIMHLNDKNKKKSEKSYSDMDKVIACSNKAWNSAVKLYPFLKPKMQMIYNPIDLDKVRSMSLEPVNEYDFDGINIIAAGRLEKQKGFEYLIQAHKMLLDLGMKHRLIILGEGSELPNLQKLAYRLGVEGSVRMPGYLNNPYSWIARADVFALSSRYEGLCNIIIESLAVGTPVVSANCPGGPSEILSDGEFGLLFEVGDVDGMAASLMKMLEDPELRDGFIAKGFDRAERFSTKWIMTDIESAIMGA